MAKEYPVGTLAQMAAIPEEAWPRLIAELPDMLRAQRDLSEYHRLLNVMFKGVAEVQTGDMIWQDDGERHRTVTVRTKDGEEVFSVSSRDTTPTKGAQ